MVYSMTKKICEEWFTALPKGPMRSGLLYYQRISVRSGLLHYRKGLWGVCCTTKGSVWSGLLHYQKGLWGVVCCTTKGSVWSGLLHYQKGLWGVVCCTTKGYGKSGLLHFSDNLCNENQATLVLCLCFLVYYDYFFWANAFVSFFFSNLVQ